MNSNVSENQLYSSKTPNLTWLVSAWLELDFLNWERRDAVLCLFRFVVLFTWTTSCYITEFRVNFFNYRGSSLVLWLRQSGTMLHSERIQCEWPDGARWRTDALQGLTCGRSGPVNKEQKNNTHTEHMTFCCGYNDTASSLHSKCCSSSGRISRILHIAPPTFERSPVTKTGGGGGEELGS